MKSKRFIWSTSLITVDVCVVAIHCETKQRLVIFGGWISSELLFVYIIWCWLLFNIFLVLANSQTLRLGHNLTWAINKVSYVFLVKLQQWMPSGRGQLEIVLIPRRENAHFEASGPLTLNVKGHNSNFIGIVTLFVQKDMRKLLWNYFSGRFSHVCFQWVSTQLHSILSATANHFTGLTEVIKCL